MTYSPARPRFSSPRRADRPTWGPRVAKVADALGKPLMPWQRDLVDVALEVKPDGRLAYRTVIVTVPRQSGKSTLAMAKNIQRMVDANGFGGRQRIVYAAQTRNDAREKLVDDWIEDLKTRKRFAGRWTSRLTLGNEQIRWENGSTWGITSNTEKAGHGKTLDVGDMDEVFSHRDDRLEQALSPAMVTRPNAQLWIVSTAGYLGSSPYLWEKVQLGRGLADSGVDEGVCYVEYSAEEGCDPEDPATWWSCMPALGHTVTEDIIRGEFQKMGVAGFSRAYLNLWIPAGYGQQVIPADDWDSCEDEASEIDGDNVVFALDVAPGSAWGSIAVAGYRADGIPHAEVIDNRDGDGWLVGRLMDLRDRWGDRPIVLDPSSPAGGLLAELVNAGFRITTISGRELSQACAALKSAAKEGAIRHLGQRQITDALAGAKTRKLLDSWAWSRTSSSCDISPLVALTNALWGLSTIPLERELTDEELMGSVG